MLFAFAGSDRALGPLGRGGKDEKIYLRQPDRRVEGEPNFLSFFARNPLKSHDSEKEMKVNESDFACFYFHFLSLSSTLSCSARSQAGQLSPRESGRGRRKRRSRSPRCYSPADRFAARTVFAINMAMVIRPTPPGTGVIAPATAAASA